MMLFALILLIGIYPVVGVIVLFTDQSQLAHVDNRLEVRMTTQNVGTVADMLSRFRRPLFGRDLCWTYALCS